MVLVVALVVGGLGGVGCFGPATLEDACGNVCDCLSVLPSQAEQCSDMCATDPDNQGIGPDCLDCIATRTCNELEAQDVCQLECGAFATLMTPSQ